MERQDPAERRPGTVRYGVTDTPLGPVWIGVSERGVCDVTLGASSEQRYRARLSRWASDARGDSGAVAAVAGELDAYFAGRLTQFSVPLDLTRVTPFTLRVLRAAQRIAFGCVTSYGDIARGIGAPAASRAVGGALGRNPVPIIVPCHRVVTHARQLGGFTGGVDFKRALLRLEGHALTGESAGTRVDPQAPGASAGGCAGEPDSGDSAALRLR
ncbi:MAG: methylated-DNA--[protein]-cysteine S-methyltransferase [Acidobacteria bacterium]|nr:methylated-DNA--[protein]-cysteine S-methyltransferase [Acidobacteriota bacterium]